MITKAGIIAAILLCAAPFLCGQENARAVERQSVAATRDVGKSDVALAVDSPAFAAPIGHRKGKFGPGVTQPRRTDLKPSKSPEVGAWKVFVSFSLIVVLMGAAFYVLKRLAPRIAGQRGGDILRLNAQLRLDPKTYLALVRVHEQEILVAVGANGVTALDRFAALDSEDETEPDLFESREGQSKNATPEPSGPRRAARDAKPFSMSNMEKGGRP